MKSKNTFFGLVFIIGVVLISGCASTGPGTRKFGSVRVPPGVEPLIAVRADSLSRQLFVTHKAEVKAREFYDIAEHHSAQSDSLWAALDKAVANPTPVATEDSIKALRKTIEGSQQVQKALPLVQQYVRVQDRQTQIQATYHLQEAERSLSQALKLNPIFVPARQLLAHVYKQLADRFIDKTNYDRAIEIWETLIRLEPGEYVDYFQLGQNYYASNRFQKALDNFEECEYVLLASAEVSDRRINDPTLPVAAAVDSNVLFAAAYYQAQSAIRLVNEEKAVASLNRALDLARTPDNRQAVETYITWINWDDDNIRGVVDRDSALALTARGDHESAAKLFEKMLPKLRTERARHEISLKLASLEYSNLSLKATAIARMLSVIESIPKDSNGAPIDRNSEVYFDSYGAMCHNLGIENTEVDRKLAYTYFMQSSSINWKSRGKSYLMMATLAQADPKQAIEDAEKALALTHHLTPDEVVSLHKMLINSYRRTRQFDKAKVHMEELRRLEQGGADGSASR